MRAGRRTGRDRMVGVLERLQRWVEGRWFLLLARSLFLAYAKVVLRLRVLDAGRVPREGGVVMAINHLSGLDPPVVGVSVPREIHFMAKRELFERPVSRLLMRGLRAFPVDRERNDVGAIKEAMRRLRRGLAIGIFAQGTRNAGAAEALDGAAFLAQRAGVPLQPVAVWREGGAFRVRFGEPFEVGDRSRDAVRAATAETMRRIRGLVPDAERAFRAGASPAGDAEEPREPVERP